jgi:hypothetical protein
MRRVLESFFGLFRRAHPGGTPDATSDAPSITRAAPAYRRTGALCLALA